jgi:hypothetical protein
MFQIISLHHSDQKLLDDFHLTQPRHGPRGIIYPPPPSTHPPNVKMLTFHNQTPLHSLVSVPPADLGKRVLVD